MQRYALYIVYVLMVSVGLVAMYAILNAGNPASLLRRVFSNPAMDVYVAAGASFIVFVLGFIVFFNRDHQEIQQLLRINREKIRDLRRQGRSDGDIADAILSAMGSRRGYRHNLVRKKLKAYLAQFE